MTSLVPTLGPAFGIALMQGGAALVCAASALKQLPLSGPRRWWMGVSVSLALFAVNSLAHIDYAMVLFMREVALDDRWYAQRRPLQMAALALLAISAGHAASRMGPAVRQLGFDLRLAATGLAMLCALLILRLVSLHHTDSLLDLRLGQVSIGRWIEALALGLVVAANLGTLFRPRPAMKQRIDHV